MSNQETPKIRRIQDVGEFPFQIIGNEETILQGWDPGIHRNVFLFKTPNGVWGYFDKGSNSIIENIQWDKKKALVNGRWVEMALYHRLDVRFQQPIMATVYSKEDKSTTQGPIQEANITIADKCYKNLMAQTAGRDPNSFYKFVWISKTVKGRTVTYPENALWVM